MLYLLIAALMGLLAAILPSSISMVALGGAVFVLCISATPFAALTVLLICAPLRALIDVRSPGLLPLDAGQLGLLLMVGAWLIYRVAHKKPLFRFQYSPVLIAIGLFLAAGALSGFTAVNIGVWLNDWLKWVFVFSLAAWVLSAGNWEWPLFALALAGIANALVGIWIYFGGSGAAHFMIDATHYRAFGTFEQPNPFGGFMGMLSPLFGAAAFGYFCASWRRRSSRWPDAFRLAQAAFYMMAAGLTAIALIFSWSRGAWLAFGVAVVVVMAAMPRRIWVSVIITISIGALGFAALMSGRLPASITNRIGSAFTDLVSVSDVRGANVSAENYAVIERLAHWQAAVEMARLQPFTGIGLGNYEVVYPQVRLMAWNFPLGHAHNYYLNVLAEAGMIGLVAYGGMWCILAALTWRARRHPDTVASAIAAGLLGSWTYIAVHSMTDQLYVNYVFLHVGIMMGITALLHTHTWIPNRLKLL